MKRKFNSTKIKRLWSLTNDELRCIKGGRGKSGKDGNIPSGGGGDGCPPDWT